MCMWFLGKAEIMAFKELHSNITHTWSKIYTKVFNERKTAREKIKKHLKKSVVWPGVRDVAVDFSYACNLSLIGRSLKL